MPWRKIQQTTPRLLLVVLVHFGKCHCLRQQLPIYRSCASTPHLYPERLMLAARRPSVNFADAKL
eukprot:SAG25_NODE_5741_length_624_cov_1.506667_1_plen_64_part_01